MTTEAHYLRPTRRPEHRPVASLAHLAEQLTELGQEIDRDVAEIRAVRTVLEKINTGLRLDGIAGFIFDSFRNMIPYERLGLALLEDRGTRVRAHWARSDAGPLILGAGYSAPLEGSTLQRILRTGRPRVLNDLPAYLEHKPTSDSTLRIVQEGFRSSLTCPLIAEGTAIGFLFFSSTSRNTYATAHAEQFVDVANTLSVIVQKGRLYEQLAAANRSLEETIEQLRRANERIAQLVLTDQLTELANRRALDEAMARATSFARRQGLPLTLVLADLDHFKKVNDTHGHATGDQVLEAAARILSDCSRREDTVGRWGGEEFLAVLPGVDLEAGLRYAERARRTLASSSIAGLTVTASFGVATLAPNEPVVDLLRRADAALYEAKESGRNRVRPRTDGAACPAEAIVRAAAA